MTEAQIIFSILTIIAIFTGPVAAVRVGRVLDDRRLRDARRMDLFRTLMRTRRLTLSPDHVGSLNLVEIEFQDESPVIDAWKAYFQNLGERWPPDLSSDETYERGNVRSALLSKLLAAMADSLNFKIQQLDIFQGGYTPQGWSEDEENLRRLRYAMIQILEGHKALPITPVTQPGTQPPPAGPYPPPP